MMKGIIDDSIVCGGIVVFECPSLIGRGGEMNVGVFVGEVHVPRERVEGNPILRRGRKNVAIATLITASASDAIPYAIAVHDHDFWGDRQTLGEGLME
jgi:hypothetical protein